MKPFTQNVMVYVMRAVIVTRPGPGGVHVHGPFTPGSDWADLTARTYYTATRFTHSNKGDPDERYGIGTFGGVAVALAACTGLSWFGVRLDPEVYYIDRLPVNVDGGDYALVALAAFLICTISTIYPAYAASELRPVDGLRWE